MNRAESIQWSSKITVLQLNQQDRQLTSGLSENRGFALGIFKKCGIVQLLDFDFQLIGGPGVVLVFSNYAL